MPQQQTLSYISRDLAQLRTQQPRFGLELWQVFLGLTLILSIASGLMWFSSLAPHNKKLEFLFIDSSKSAIFTSVSSLELLNAEYKDKAPLQASVEGSCYSDIANLTIKPDSLIEPTQLALDTRLQIEALKNDIPTKTNLLSDGVNNLYDYIDASDSYALSVYDYYQTKSELYKIRLEVQKQVAIMCQSDFGLLPTESKKLDDILKTISASSSKDYIVEWLTTVSSWNSVVGKIDSYASYTALNEEEKSQIKKDFVSIFELDFGDINANMVEGIQAIFEQMLSRLETIESWQRDLQQKNAMYKDIAVFTKK